MSKRSADYMAQRYADRKKQGLCPRCGLPSTNYVYCYGCREHQAEYTRQARAKALK